MSEIPIKSQFDDDERRNTLEMMRFLGNTVAKSCRRGRLQYREFSSASEKDKTFSEKVVDFFVEYGFKGTFCGAGYVLGGIISKPVAKNVQETEKWLLEREHEMAEHEARLEVWMKGSY